MRSLIDQGPKRPLRLIATSALLAAAAIARPAASSASPHKVQDVHAKLTHGTLEVKGGHRSDAVALRLKAGDPSQVQVAVGDDGSAEFAFARSDVAAIAVRM